MRALITLSLAFALTSVLSGCSYFSFWSSAEEPIAAKSKERKPRASTNEELELKDAKLWARMDSLEAELTRQKQRFAVLEKGLMLGLIPEELKQSEDHASTSNPGTLPSDPVEELRQAPVTPLERASTPAPKEIRVEVRSKPVLARAGDKAEGSAADKAWAQADDYRKNGQWSRAVLAYGAFMRDFPDSAKSGDARFYLAQSWSRSHEFSLAADEFSKFLRDQGDSALTGQARLELAAVYEAQGFRDKAVQGYQDVIARHGSEDVARIARDKLANMEKAL
jgi:TolA-binding protein